MTISGARQTSAMCHAFAFTLDETEALTPHRRSSHRPATLATDAALRRLASELYPDHSANDAAGELANRASKYRASQYLHDRAGRRRPADDPLRTFFDLFEAGKKLSERSMRRALDNERC